MLRISESNTSLDMPSPRIKINYTVLFVGESRTDLSAGGRLVKSC
jgi:hypothetical protein